MPQWFTLYSFQDVVVYIWTTSLWQIIETTYVLFLLLNCLCILYSNFFENNLHLASLFDSYYDEDQEKLFNEAHVISPFRKMSEVVRQPQVQVTVGIILMW